MKPDDSFYTADEKARVSDTGQAEATHEQICDQALLHYESLAKECCSWSSVVPRAIKFYRQYGSESNIALREKD